MCMRNNNLGWVKRLKFIFLELYLDIYFNDMSHYTVASSQITSQKGYPSKKSVTSKPMLKTYRSERSFEICNLNLYILYLLVEDEIHFICLCPMYQELRDELCQNVLSLERLF